jgi:radical SAM superfamily enzyme YgiQ (UPF0313 family)
MTPEQIEKWLAENAWKLDGPAQWIGQEPNAVRKPWDSATVRWLLAASWPYFHSAGNQAIPAVYQAINDNPQCLADLSYLAETPRDMRIMEKAGLPVFGIESKHQARDFDVMGTSISYMVLFMNFLKHLSLAGIPLRWKDREAQGLENFPMVIVGGQAACAPGAMEPVVDCVWIGEVEDEPGNPGGISEVCDRITEFKQDGTWQEDRLAAYRALAREYNHLYFPRFTSIQYRYVQQAQGAQGLAEPSKQVASITPLLEGMRFPHRSRRVVDMDAIAPLRSAPLLFTQPGMGAGDIEVARSCPAWCSFCRLALTTKPYRQATVDRVVRQAKEWKLNMGSVELSPFSPDFPMHTQRLELLARLMEEVSDETDGTAMRIDDFIADPDYMLLYTAGRATAVTLGLEGNSQRMRDLVGKGTSDKEVIEAVTRGIHAGVRKFKLFMISQFPGEEVADVMRIVRLGQKLDGIRRDLGARNVQFVFSWTPLLIEAQTPFQWFAPTFPDHTLMEVISQLRPYNIMCKIGTKANPPKVALFQLCQRASREVGEAIVDVLEKHAVASWGGVPQTMREDLEAALHEHGFLNGLADCFDERGRTDLFGWEHIDMGVSAQLLWNTHQQMVEFLQATDPATYDEEMGEDYHGQEWTGRCDKHCVGAACGACEPADYRKRKEYIAAGKNDRNIRANPVRPIDLSTVAFKVRMRLNIPEHLRYVTREHWRFTVRRAAYRAAADCLPHGASIAKRSIRFASDAISVRDWSYGFDYAEFGLTQNVTVGEVQLFMSRMQGELGPWAGVQGHEVYPASVSLPPGALAFYELPVDASPDTLAARLAAWDRAETVPVTLAADTAYFGPGTEEVDAKELVEDIWAIQSGHQMRLRFLARGKAGPYQLGAAFLGTAPIPLQRHPALRLEWFIPDPPPLLTPDCLGCGRTVLPTLLGETDHHWCVRCDSLLSGEARGILVGTDSIS